MSDADKKSTLNTAWGLLAASIMCLSALSFCVWAASLMLEPLKLKILAGNYADKQIAAAGLDWPRLSLDDIGGGSYRCLYKDPDDDGRFADIVVRQKRDEWAVVRFNREFRPWNVAKASR